MISTTAVALFLLKASVLLGGAFLIAQALRREHAVRRHRAWTFAFIALVALPALAGVLPALHVTVPTWNAASSRLPAVVQSAVAPTFARLDAAERVARTLSAGTSTVAMTTTAFSLPSLRPVIFIAWALGAFAALVALIVSLVRAHRLASSGHEIEDDDWLDACAAISARLGMGRHVRIISSSEVVTPMASGVVRPTVFVPSDATLWSAEVRDIVLSHEIAHLASGDPLRHVVSRLAFTIYWFHPLVWLAARKAAAACEHACDEAVLMLGVRPSTYARVLLDFADSAPRSTPSVALPMVKTGTLEARLMSILDGSPRRSPRRRALLPIVAIALTLSLAAAKPSVSAPSDTSAESPTETSATTATKLAAPEARKRVAAATPSSYQPSQADCWAEYGGGTIINQRAGRRGYDHVITKTFGDLRVCAVGENLEGESGEAPSRWMGRASRVVLETRQSNDIRRLEIVGNQAQFTINGSARPLDGAAEAWRDRLFAVLDATWELSQLRGRVSSLRGEISSIHGERSALEGEISALRGEVSARRGNISALRGDESALRGEISSIRGHVSSLEGAISSERGSISSLRASRWDVDGVAARIRQHEEAIARIEDEIRRYDGPSRVREVERRIDALDTERKVETIERGIREFELEGRVAAIRRRIADLEVEPRVSGIERDISAIELDRRLREYDVRIEAALGRLRATLER
jgi:beta-lactamase regulating signal transducer with metallopeptidase domain/predicted  nucleic acid-binding Zn-ribbon protein